MESGLGRLGDFQQNPELNPVPGIMVVALTLFFVYFCLEFKKMQHNAE
jgi:hypothetical protein